MVLHQVPGHFLRTPASHATKEGKVQGASLLIFQMKSNKTLLYVFVNLYFRVSILLNLTLEASITYTNWFSKRSPANEKYTYHLSLLLKKTICAGKQKIIWLSRLNYVVK